MTPEDLRRRLDFSDDQLMAECEVHIHRTGGPGGQHRNKVATAIRLVHGASGLVSTAGETRSQHENKARAAARLRELIAAHARLPLPSVVSWPDGVRIDGERLKVSPRNPAVNHVVALVLDALFEHKGKLSEAAGALGVSASSMTRFLGEHPPAWTQALAIRKEHGLGPLRL